MLLETHNMKFFLFLSLTFILMSTSPASNKTSYERDLFNATRKTNIISLEKYEENDQCDFIVEKKINLTYDGLMKITSTNKTAYERLSIDLNEHNITINRTNGRLNLCVKEEYCRRHDDTEATNCFRKCCQSGEVFIGDKCASKRDFTFSVHDFGNFGYTDVVPIYYFKPDCDLRPHDRYLVHTTARGAIKTIQLDKYINITPEVHDYCFDMHSEDHTAPPKPYLFVCMAKDNIRTQCLQVAFYISCTCLTMTIIIYCTIYKFGKIMNWVIVSTCSSLLCGFLFVSVRQLLPNIEEGCDVISFGTLIGLISAFSWLGVMCYDVWRTVASMKAHVGKSNLWKRYMLYSIFGWLYPLAIGALAYLENQYSFLPNNFHVTVGFLYRGRRYCKVSNGITHGNYSFLLFYIIPITIPILCNVICFTFTIRYIIQARRLIRRSSRLTQEVHANNNEVTKMVLKLFLIMGVSWVWEIISQIIDFKTNIVTETIEAILDTANCLQGLFIFLIFGVRWKAVKAKFSKFQDNKKSVITLTESI